MRSKQRILFGFLCAAMFAYATTELLRLLEEKRLRYELLKERLKKAEEA